MLRVLIPEGLMRTRAFKSDYEDRMVGKPKCSSNSIAGLLQTTNKHPNYMETGTSSSELKSDF